MGKKIFTILRTKFCLSKPKVFFLKYEILVVEDLFKWDIRLFCDFFNDGQLMVQCIHVDFLQHITLFQAQIKLWQELIWL